MKKIIFFLTFIVLCFCIGIIGCAPVKNTYERGFWTTSELGAETENEISTQSDLKKIEDNKNKTPESGNGVLKHGWLKAVNGKIIDKNGDNVVLRGMSSHGLVWFPSFSNKYSIQ